MVKKRGYSKKEKKRVKRAKKERRLIEKQNFYTFLIFIIGVILIISWLLYVHYSVSKNMEKIDNKLKKIELLNSDLSQ